MMKSSAKAKEAYNSHRHDNIKYNVGEILVMRRAPNSTGESTTLQNRFRGPLVITEVLPGDVYWVVELNNGKQAVCNYSSCCPNSSHGNWWMLIIAMAGISLSPMKESPVKRTAITKHQEGRDLNGNDDHQFGHYKYFVIVYILFLCFFFFLSLYCTLYLLLLNNWLWGVLVEKKKWLNFYNNITSFIFNFWMRLWELL